MLRRWDTTVGQATALPRLMLEDTVGEPLDLVRAEHVYAHEDWAHQNFGWPLGEFDVRVGSDFILDAQVVVTERRYLVRLNENPMPHFVPFPRLARWPLTRRWFG